MKRLTSIVVLSLLCSCGGEDGIKATTLEDVADNGGAEAFVAAAHLKAKATVKDSSIEAINSALRPHDRIYKPHGDGPFPVALFFHGCSGPTLSHEEDWAAFYNDIGVALVAVDSYKGRGIDWNDACNLMTMTPWQRAADVLASIAWVHSLDWADKEQIVLSGFSHGAMTVWASLHYAASKTPPLSLPEWPETGMNGVILAPLFYGSCSSAIELPITTYMFLGENDRYIDEQSCIDYLEQHPSHAEHFSYRIFGGATHTFDHSKPNASNVEAGSVYDEKATVESQNIIKAALQR